MLRLLPPDALLFCLLLTAGACGGDADASPIEALKFDLDLTVVDRDGAPVHPATVHLEVETMQDGERIGLQFTRNVETGPGGRVRDRTAVSWGVPRSRRAEFRVQLQARDLARSCEASAVAALDVPADGTIRRELRLGPPRATVPVRIRDRGGRAVETFWLRTARVDGGDDIDMPRVRGTFAGGATDLAIPPAPFTVTVQRPGGRSAEVGPFDPSDLPAELAIGLPD